MYWDRQGVAPRALIVVVAACALLLMQGGVAQGREMTPGRSWPLASNAPVLLGFGASYGDAGASRTHSGVDLASDAGEAVRAPVDATVVFAGRVPAAGGGRQVAVTLQDGEGAKVTLMPLAEAAVSAGDHVDTGAMLGMLAASGDGSSSETHLHVGVREGTLYIDPLGFLVRPPAVVVPEPSPEPAAGLDPAQEPAVGPSALPPAPAAPGVLVPATPGAPAPVSVAHQAMHPAATASGPVAAGATNTPATRPVAASDPDAATSAQVGTSAQQAPRSAAVVSQAPLESARHATSLAASRVEAMAAAAGGSVRQAAGRATATPPTLITSLPGLIKLFQVRDRLLVTALSYLLATIAAVSCLGAVSRSALRPLKAGPVALGVGSLSD